MESSWTLGLIVAGTVFPMVQVWHRRERLIRRELARRGSQALLRAQTPLLEHCVEKLLAEYGVDTFARPQLTAPPPADSNRRSYLTGLLEVSAERWQITPPSTNISLVPQRERDECAGSFMSGSAAWLLTLDGVGRGGQAGTPGWEILIDPAYLQDDLALSVLIAHEFAHGVLGRDGVTLPGVSDNEVLTDVAAALIGFGRLMLKLQRRVIRGFRGRELTVSVGGPGYLWPPALEHIIRRHSRLLAETVLV